MRYICAGAGLLILVMLPFPIFGSPPFNALCNMLGNIVGRWVVPVSLALWLIPALVLTLTARKWFVDRPFRQLIPVMAIILCVSPLSAMNNPEAMLRVDLWPSVFYRLLLAIAVPFCWLLVTGILKAKGDTGKAPVGKCFKFSLIISSISLLFIVIPALLMMYLPAMIHEDRVILQGLSGKVHVGDWECYDVDMRSRYVQPINTVDEYQQATNQKANDLVMHIPQLKSNKSLVEPENVQFSPDKTYFAGLDKYQAIWLVDLKAQSAKRLGWGESPCFSPKGTQLAWIDHRGKEAKIIIYDYIKGKSRSINAPNCTLGGLAWSPDMHYFAYTGDQENPFTENFYSVLRVVTADGKRSASVGFLNYRTSNPTLTWSK